MRAASSSTPAGGSSYTSKILLLKERSNNSIEANFLECVEKEDFKFDRLEQCHAKETDSNAGRVGHVLQEKTVKLINRRR